MIEHDKLLYQPDRVSAPGLTLLDLLAEHGMTEAELAKRTGCPLSTINGIIEGKVSITYEIATILERVFGTPVTFWIQREANYQTYLRLKMELE
jgi:HTH-type transcriptional regulator/antitoxin HigA